MSITTKGIKWGIGTQTVIGTAVAATAGIRVRSEGGVSDLKPNMEHINVPMKDGRWGESDYTQRAGISRPGWPGAPLLLSVGLIEQLLQQMCDESAPDAGGNITYTLKAAGCNPATDHYLSIIRRNELASSKDKRLTAGAVASIKLSSSESANAVKMDCDFLGTALAVDYDGSGDVFTMPSEAFLLHKGLTFKIGAADTKCPEYDVNIDFGLKGIVDNAAAVSEFILGKFNCTGTVRIPWADDDVINDFMTSVSNTLTFLWGVADSSGYLEIKVPIKYTEPDEDTDNDLRLRQSLPFEYRETAAQAFEVILQA